MLAELEEQPQLAELYRRLRCHRGAACLTSLALFGTGTGITLVTGRGPWRSGFRQVVLGLAAAALTYRIGSLLGVAIAG